ncbi:MAG TPA: putative beta-lysine N-acetyltransferase [Bacillota bacterium]|nr:putative beta-lysine N-acetyltransferase [Bacillota bacterium]
MQEWLVSHEVLLDMPNKRIKVMNGQLLKDPNFFSNLNQLEESSKCTKTIIYTTKKNVPIGLDHGFALEGSIDGFYNGQNAYLLTRYQSVERATSKALLEGENTLTLVQKDLTNVTRKILPSNLSLRQAKPTDVQALSTLFRLVFPHYPTPVYDPNYLIKAMENTVFMVIHEDDCIVSVCSAEMMPGLSCAEITDCTTDPRYRGQNLLSYLFFALEEKMKQLGIYYLYSLTRALSPPMNLTVKRHGYEYRGRLINNCVIYTGFEDMFIWVKPLRPTWD